MKKFNLILDSSSSISLEEANKRKIGFIPLRINVDGKNLKAGIDINGFEMYEMMLSKPTVSTSLPTGKDLMTAFDKALETAEMAVYVGISHKMSGTNNSAKVIAKMDEYKGKIFVYESQYLSPWTGLHIDAIQDIVQNGTSYERIKELLDFQNEFMIGYLSPGDIYWFYKGGRITKTQYTMANLLKIKPILTISNGEIDKSKIDKARSFEKAIEKMCVAVEADIEKVKSLGLNYHVVILESENKELNKKTLDSVSTRLDVNKKDIIEAKLSAEQTAHMGPTSFGVSLKVDFKEVK